MRFRNAPAPATGEGDGGERLRPRLTLPHPEGWFAKESLTLLAPDGQANVIASGEPIPSDIDVASYADVQGGHLRAEFPRYLEHEFGPAVLANGLRGYRRRFEWAPPDGVPVMQIQFYYADPGRGYTATATTPATQFDRFEPTFQRILGGLQLDRR